MIRIVATGLAALVLAGCAGAPTPQAPARGGDDGRVVLALDDFAALNALSLGIQPDLVLEVFDYATTSAVFDDAGLATQPYGTGLDLEQVIAAAPDVILGVSIPTTVEVQADLERIAPTTVLDYTATWQEQLDATATALGVPERAAALRQRLDDGVAELSRDLDAAGQAGATVSVLGFLDGAFSPPVATPAGAVLSDAGLDRPAAQQQSGSPSSPFVTIAEETLPDHAAGVVYLLTGGQYPAASLTDSPLWPQVGTGDTFEVSAETWLGSSAFSVDWITRDVRATLLDGTSPAGDADAPARFREFLSG